MINMFDTNMTGTIDVTEFGRLFTYIQQWKAMFEGFDRDRSDSNINKLGARTLGARSRGTTILDLSQRMF